MGPATIRDTAKSRKSAVTAPPAGGAAAALPAAAGTTADALGGPPASAPAASRRRSSVDFFVVALALSAVAASTLCSATVVAADGVLGAAVGIDDEEVLIPWKKARPRGPPRFGKRALPPFFSDADDLVAASPHGADAASASLSGKRALRAVRADLPEGVEFLQRVFRLDGVSRPLPAQLHERYARYA